MQYYDFLGVDKSHIIQSLQYVAMVKRLCQNNPWVCPSGSVLLVLHLKRTNIVYNKYWKKLKIEFIGHKK